MAGEPSPSAFSPTDVAAPAANTAAVVVYAGLALCQHLISGLACSYSGAGTLSGGNVKIEDGSVTVLSLDVETKGTYSAIFTRPQHGTAGCSLTITLAAGGSNVTGKLSVLGHAMRAVSTLVLGTLDFGVPGNSGYLVVA